MGKKTNKQSEQSFEVSHEGSPSRVKNVRKKPWTDNEDNLVRTLVQKYGPQRWSFIAKFVPGRLGKQCRERWHNHLNPKILKSEWSF